jgi:RNA-directed DNA polymerase
MPTGLERIAAKARQEPKLRFTSLAHHLNAERLWQALCHVPPHSAPGSDGQTVDELKQEFSVWSAATLRAVHTQGYRPPPVRRTYIPKPGKHELRPLGVPMVPSYCTSIQAASGSLSVLGGPSRFVAC